MNFEGLAELLNFLFTERSFKENGVGFWMTIIEFFQAIFEQIAGAFGGDSEAEITD
ncbi:MAG: hypothetical protein FWG82_05930 [Oscillospiraceae bacterium]|nr:hypothetical protein [Oscillospiraceae bacterium]